MKRVNLVGQRYGRLVVLEMIYNGPSRAKCMCDCGGQKIARAANLQSGNTSSCGCKEREIRAAQAKARAEAQALIRKKKRPDEKHGKRNTRTYIKWLDARKRCFRPQNKSYKNYGGRGITMDPRWAASFEAFLADMGEAPPGLTLERDDVNGNYEPGNCRWATKKTQTRNRRCTVGSWEKACAIRSRAAAGETQNQLAIAFGMSRSNVSMIVSNATWTTP